MSVHIFYSKDFNPLLTNIVAPFIHEYHSAVDDKFFFIRYFECGPHLRLRIHVVDPDNEISSVQNFKVKLMDFIKKNELNSNIQINDIHIKEAKYEPEIERYGGYQCIELIESHFYSSSEVVLSMLADTNFFQEKLFSYAIILQILFSASLGYDRNSLSNLFYNIYINWSRHCELDPTFSLDVKKEIDNRYHYFQSVYTQILSVFESNQVFEETWLNKWCTDSRKFSSDLHSLYALDAIEVFSTKMHSTFYEHTHSIVQSCLHMLNNRLGISNQQEALLAYHIHQWLSRT